MANSAVETAKSVKNQNATILYLYQPSGIENYMVSNRIFLGTNKSGVLIKTKIARGVHSMRLENWEIVKADPVGKKLMESPRQLIEIASGEILPRDIIDVRGVYGSISVMDAIERTYNTNLLESWITWLNNDGLNYADRLPVLGAINTQIDGLKTGKVVLPMYLQDNPEANTSKVTSII
jgi:hypothetical protein